MGPVGSPDNGFPGPWDECLLRKGLPGGGPPGFHSSCPSVESPPEYPDRGSQGFPGSCSLVSLVQCPELPGPPGGDISGTTGPPSGSLSGSLGPLGPSGPPGGLVHLVWPEPLGLWDIQACHSCNLLILLHTEK